VIGKPPSIYARGFSLAELLMVLAIMGILSALAVSSISSLRSAGLSASGNQLVDVFAMARQNSISKNDFTAVVILTQGPEACSAYSLLELPGQPDGTMGTSWTQLTPWRYLPKGIVFENDQASIDTFMTTLPWASLPAPTSTLLTSCPFQGSQINLTMAAIMQCYQPDGTLIGGQPLRLRVIEGTANSAGTVTYNGATVSGAQVSYYDLYFIANTGATKVGRL
jgi:prepilin-type N-terminal cleavage/methylation domain-containing protein